MLAIKSHDLSKKRPALKCPDFDKSAAQKHLRHSDSYTYVTFGIRLGCRILWGGKHFGDTRHKVGL
jgi:hypothetical protein